MKAALVLLAACSFAHGTNGTAGSDGGGRDAPGDTVVDGRPDAAPNCYGSGLVTICAQLPVPATWDVTAPATIDTGMDAQCDFIADEPSGALCVKQAQNVTLSDSLGLDGTRGLVILATDSLTIASTGSIDASSFGGDNGPGANPGSCTAGTPAGSDNGNGQHNGGGGGAGGSYGGTGGNGSDGAKSGATAGPTLVATAVVGGCPGSAGGNGDSPHLGGTAGAGGGAVYLIAGNSIAISGAINASGAPGLGGDLRSGGGGGGAGGLIGLDAPTVQVTASAQVFANGGGGGEGGDTTDPGFDGGASLSPDVAGLGGLGNSAGGDGGDGAAGTVLGGGSGAARVDNAGGGGGGGAGIVKVFAAHPEIAGAISPPPS
ncbi:MAG TPA: hypothetical protein VLX92_30155 [Kofleriaceae bacterium]|nr:hypothetical protein [Kofleriaceae bacterium]